MIPVVGAHNSRKTGCLVLIGLLVGLVVLESVLPHKSRSEQIREGCQREFGSEGAARVNECSIEIMARELEQGERDKTERAANHR